MRRNELETHALLAGARARAARGEDAAAIAAYVAVLRAAPTQFAALNELAGLAYAGGHRAAARTAYTRAVVCHPHNPVGHVNLANLLLEDGDCEAARRHYLAALAAAPDCAPAHQGLARVLDACGEHTAAAEHRERGFRGNAVVTRPCRGPGPGVPLLLLVSAAGGNIPTRAWIDERRFAVTAIYTEFVDPGAPLPAHALVVNAIADADRCGLALERAAVLVARTTAPVINPPSRVLGTGRAAAMRRLAGLPGVVAPTTELLPRAAILSLPPQRFPLLLRAPGYHTGQHFLRVPAVADLPAALASLPGGDLLAIDELDARGTDGMVRKYRVMIIGGALYPIHLAVSAHWKVHYFTAAMDGFRAEEQRFLADMPGVLGARAIAALHAIGAALGLDYCGVDFALDSAGQLLLFEANAGMVLNPAAEDYRAEPVGAAIQAAIALTERR